MRFVSIAVVKSKGDSTVATAIINRQICREIRITSDDLLGWSRGKHIVDFSPLNLIGIIVVVKNEMGAFTL